jgi:hypothetical protein
LTHEALLAPELTTAVAGLVVGDGVGVVSGVLVGEGLGETASVGLGVVVALTADDPQAAVAATQARAAPTVSGPRPKCTP